MGKCTTFCTFLFTELHGTRCCQITRQPLFESLYFLWHCTNCRADRILFRLHGWEKLSLLTYCETERCRIEDLPRWKRHCFDLQLATRFFFFTMVACNRWNRCKIAWSIQHTRLRREKLRNYCVKCSWTWWWSEFPRIFLKFFTRKWNKANQLSIIPPGWTTGSSIGDTCWTLLVFAVL